MAATAVKRKVSPLLASYRRLQKAKSAYCLGKKTKTEVEKAAKEYISKATAGGQTATEAKKKADRVRNSGCKMSSVAGTRKRTTAKTTTTRKRTTRK